jgi:multidrug efflux pump subunit AcrA (membrane-fusion protein)
MVAEVELPMPARDSTFVVPASSVVNGTERIFVVRETAGHQANWVDVKLGRSQGGKVEIYSNDLKEGDQLVKTASEEIRDGSVIH